MIILTDGRADFSNFVIARHFHKLTRGFVGNRLKTLFVVNQRDFAALISVERIGFLRDFLLTRHQKIQFRMLVASSPEQLIKPPRLYILAKRTAELALHDVDTVFYVINTVLVGKPAVFHMSSGIVFNDINLISY